MTRDEYLLAVTQLIRNTDVASTGLRASTLGNLILRSLPQHWREHGYLALKDLLAELHRRGQAVVGEDPKGMLSVRVPAPAQAIAATQTKAWPKFVRLRTEIWRAFVDPVPAGERFLHTISG